MPWFSQGMWDTSAADTQYGTDAYRKTEVCTCSVKAHMHPWLAFELASVYDYNLGGCDGGKAYDEQASLQGDMMDSYKGKLNLWFCPLMARYLGWERAEGVLAY